MSSCCSSRRRRVCPVALSLLLVALLLLSSCPAAWCTETELMSLGASGRRPARRLLVSQPSTSRQKTEQAQQQMQVDGWRTPFKQAAASFGRRIPRSGWNPIQNMRCLAFSGGGPDS